MKAVITAGGEIDGDFAAEAGTRIKALASIRGATMLDRILAALRGNGVDRIAVIGDEEVRAAYGTRVEAVVAASPSGSVNLVRALAAWPEDGAPLVYATSDLPYVTADAVGDFLARVPPQTLAMSLVEAQRYATRFPDAPPFGLRLAGERVVNGGVFLLPPGSAARLMGLASRFFETRKRPWRMAGVIGPLTLLRFATGRLSVAHLEAKAHQVLGLPARAVRGCAPELAFDVDTIEEYRYACAHC